MARLGITGYSKSQKHPSATRQRDTSTCQIRSHILWLEPPKRALNLSSWHMGEDGKTVSQAKVGETSLTTSGINLALRSM